MWPGSGCVRVQTSCSVLLLAWFEVRQCYASSGFVMVLDHGRGLCVTVLCIMINKCVLSVFWCMRSIFQVYITWHARKCRCLCLQVTASNNILDRDGCSLSCSYKSFYVIFGFYWVSRITWDPPSRIYIVEGWFDVLMYLFLFVPCTGVQISNFSFVVFLVIVDVGPFDFDLYTNQMLPLYV